MSIVITKFQVSLDRKKIVLEVTKGGGDTIATCEIANQDQYLTSLYYTIPPALLTELNADGSIEILPSMFGVSIFDGIYFVKITGTDITDPLIAVTANLTQYFYCLNDLLAFVNTDCIDCSDGLKNVLSADLFLEGMKAALYLGRYTEAISHFKSLNKLCINRCDSCSATGATFGTLNSEFVLV